MCWLNLFFYTYKILDILAENRKIGVKSRFESLIQITKAGAKQKLISNEWRLLLGHWAAIKILPLKNYSKVSGFQSYAGCLD